jgi:hypothetical protein
MVDGPPSTIPYEPGPESLAVANTVAELIGKPFRVCSIGGERPGWFIGLSRTRGAVRMRCSTEHPECLAGVDGGHQEVSPAIPQSSRRLN